MEKKEQTKATFFRCFARSLVLRSVGALPGISSFRKTVAFVFFTATLATVATLPLIIKTGISVLFVVLPGVVGGTIGGMIGVFIQAGILALTLPECSFCGILNAILFSMSLRSVYFMFFALYVQYAYLDKAFELAMLLARSVDDGIAQVGLSFCTIVKDPIDDTVRLIPPSPSVFLPIIAGFLGLIVVTLCEWALVIKNIRRLKARL